MVSVILLMVIALYPTEVIVLMKVVLIVVMVDNASGSRE